MKVGKDFWFILRLIIAIWRALKELNENGNEPIENGG